MQQRVIVDRPGIFFEASQLHDGLRWRTYRWHLIRPAWERHGETWFIERLVYVTAFLLTAASIAMHCFC